MGNRLKSRPGGFRGWKWRWPRVRQRHFPFIDRRVRLERAFKRAIVGVTIVVIVALLAGMPSGRYAAGWLASKTWQVALRSVGLSPGRAAVDADWRRWREFDIVRARRKFDAVFASMKPPMQRLFRFGGLDPEHVLLRWGNFDRTLLLPSTVFEPDDSGRSYRLRPNFRTVWIRNLYPVSGYPSFFLLPDTPGLRDVVQSSGSVMIEESNQSTNSWGLRGAEVDVKTPLRGIVLGDSFMQGIFLADDKTPPECLRRNLEARLKTRVEVINTGHLGYSPEQCYFTLVEYADRFAPQFVVLSLFANDFGDLLGVIDGQADWDEGRYWVNQIQEYCRQRGFICLVVPAPFTNQVLEARQAGSYPGQVSNFAGEISLKYLDPIEAFVDEEIQWQINARRQGISIRPSPLFNGRIGDLHFSPLGSRIWAEAVGRRLSLLLEMHGIVSRSTDQ